MDKSKLHGVDLKVEGYFRICIWKCYSIGNTKFFVWMNRELSQFELAINNKDFKHHERIVWIWMKPGEVWHEKVYTYVDVFGSFGTWSQLRYNKMFWFLGQWLGKCWLSNDREIFV